MKKNREGYYTSDTHRECTKCGKVEERTSKTVALCRFCNSERVKSQPEELKMWRRAKTRAYNKGIPFDLSKDKVTIPASCPALGMPLVVHKGRSGGNPDSPALDRIDNSIGYTDDNVQVLSHLANMMKSSASKEQLVRFAEWVLSTYKVPD